MNVAATKSATKEVQKKVRTYVLDTFFSDCIHRRYHSRPPIDSSMYSLSNGVTYDAFFKILGPCRRGQRSICLVRAKNLRRPALTATYND